LNDNENLTQIIDLSGELAEVSNLDVLLERILTCVRRAVNAEARAIWSRFVPETRRHRVGLLFFGMSEDSRRALTSYVRKRLVTE